MIDNWMERAIKPLPLGDATSARFLLDRTGDFPQLPLIKPVEDKEAETDLNVDGGV